MATLLVAACTRPSEVQPTKRPAARYFQVALPGPSAVPLQVSDVTATVTGVELDLVAPPVGAPGETFLASVTGRRNAVLVGWPGGCEERVDIGVDPPSQPGARPTFTLKLLIRPGSCAIELPRRVVVVFESPVEADGFNLDVVQ